MRSYDVLGVVLLAVLPGGCTGAPQPADPTPSEMPTTEAPPAPQPFRAPERWLRLVDVPAGDSAALTEDRFPCQPAGGDPLAEQADFEAEVVPIDGLEAPAGLTVRLSRFSCPGNDVDYVLEVLQNGQRKGYFTHITRLGALPGGKRLFMRNLVTSAGQRRWRVRILDLEAWSLTDFDRPRAACFGKRLEYLPEHGLLLSTGWDDASTIHACLWTAEGRRIGGVSYPLSFDLMPPHLRVLSADPAVLVVSDAPPCMVGVANLTKQEVRYARIGDQPEFCHDVWSIGDRMTLEEAATFGEVH